LKRTARTNLKITANHAAHALHLLISEGKIAAKDVTNALKRREAMIADLRRRLGALEAGAIVAAKSAGKKIARGRRRLSAARRAALKLHGQYLGTVRPLSKAARAKVKAIREAKGIRAAIAAARKMAD
jgi:hypothetical protein